MAQEIERKFLVKGDFKQFAHQVTRITQGYLSSVPERAVRVRMKGDNCFLTIKGKGNASGMSRYEWEKEITKSEFEELFLLCEPGAIDKSRYLVLFRENVFEVDEFYGENEGLLLAEIELNNEEDEFEKPEWLGEEVTGNTLYYNSSLTKLPYSAWK